MEAYPIADKSIGLITRLWVDIAICQHGLLYELLSDRREILLSEVIRVFVTCLMKKFNATANHPRTEGLVGNFNCTLHSMLVKHSKF